MKRNRSRIIAIILALVMCVGFLPVSTLADEAETGAETAADAAAAEDTLAEGGDEAGNAEADAKPAEEPASDTSEEPQDEPGDAPAADDTALTVNSVTTTVISGAAKNARGHWVKTAAGDDAAGQEYTFRVSYAFTGREDFKENEVEFFIPNSVLCNLNGETANSIDLSVPWVNDSGLTDANPFVYDYTDGGIRIFNRIGLDSSQFGYFEVTYATTERTFEYQDYDPDHPELSLGALTVDLTITHNGETASKSAEPLNVYLDTEAVVTRVEKNVPTLYDSWETSWGEEPENANDYYYLVWEIRTWIRATQTYDFALEDYFDITDGGVVGYRLSGERTYTENNRAENVKINQSVFSRYDYVLTRHLKSTYDPLLESDGKYTLQNSVTVQVTPTGGVDSASEMSAEQSWTHREARYVPPYGYFWSEKWQKDNTGTYIRNSNAAYPSSFALGDLAKGKVQEISGLGFYAYVYGYAYKWTYYYDGEGEGPDENHEDSKYYYGNRPVLITISDKDLALETIDGSRQEKLAAGDYRIDSLRLRYEMYTGIYDELTKEFKRGELTSRDIELFVELDSSGNWVRAATLKPTGWEIYADELIRNPTLSDRTASIEFLNEDALVTGYQFTTFNSLFYTRLDTYPELTLIGTDKVVGMAQAAIDSGDPRLVLVNKSQTAGYQCREKDGDNFLFMDKPFYAHYEDTAEDYIYGASRRGTVSKQPVGYYNDVINHAYTITWSGRAEETAQNAEGEVTKVAQTSGVFYDLVPRGGEFVNGSVSAFADGVELTDGEFTVTAVEPYKDSGRTLVIIRINVPGDEYYFTYKTNHGWDSIKEHGKYVRNLLAYETGNDEIGGGYPDDGGGVPEADREYMTDLDPDSDGARFLYDTASHDITAITSGSLGLYKRVKTGNDDDYKASSVVFGGRSYSYRIRFATDSTTSASDLIVFDSMENYTKTTGETSGWHGQLTGIDLSVPENLGIAPVVYYSTERLDIEANRNLEGGAWTKCEDLNNIPFGDIKSIAIDLRTAADGTSFVLKPDKSVSITLYMQAPSDPGTETLNVEAYNNVYLQSAIDNDYTGEYTPRFESFDYTTLVFRSVGSFKLYKVDANDETKPVSGVYFRLYGTSIYGTPIDIAPKTNRNGEIRFIDIEAGTYQLQETDGRPDYLQDHSILDVTVAKDGSVTIEGEFTHGSFTKIAEGEYKATNLPRVSGDLKFYKHGSIDGAEGSFSRSGAVFMLSGKSYYGDDLKWTAESQSDGSVTFKDIDRGSNYELREIKAPAGYILSETVYRVVCDANGVVSIEGVEADENGDIILYNEPYHSFKLYKYDPATLLPIEGASFTLSGYINGARIELERKSGEGGVVSFDKLEAGSYVLTEKEAPVHYAKDETQRLVTVGNDGAVTIDGLEYSAEARAFLFPNERIRDGVITITKVWSGTEAGETLPIPVIHVSTTVPKHELPSATADAQAISQFTSDMKSFGPAAGQPDEATLAGATEIQTADSAMKVYIWDDGDGNARWWSPAPKVYLSDDCVEMFSNDRYYYTYEIPLHPELTDIDLRGFDTSRVTSTARMFYYSPANEYNLSEFSFKSVTDMSLMFGSAGSYGTRILFPAAPDTGNVKNMSGTFRNFHGDIDHLSKLDVSSVEDMTSLFADSAIRNIDLSSWDTSNVTDMYRMFSCSNPGTLNISGSFTTENVERMERMFASYKNSAEEGITVTLDLSKFDTGKVTNMREMFSFISHSLQLTLPVGFGSAAENMEGMFQYYYNSTLDLTNLDTSNCKNMNSMFFCSYLHEIDLSGFNTEKAESMDYMFQECYYLSRIDFSSFNTRSLKSCYYMLGNVGGQIGQSSGTGVYSNPDEYVTVYVGPEWDLSGVENDGYMVSGAYRLKGSKGTVYDWQKPTDKTYAHVDGGPDDPGYFWYMDPAASSGGGSNVTAMLASPARRLMLDAAEAATVDLVSTGEMYEGGGDTSEVYGKWIDNGDGTWTYRFNVYDTEATYYVYEGPVAGYTGDCTADNYYTLEYKPGEANAVTITNTKNKQDTTGSLTVINRVTGVPTDKVFKYTVVFDDASINIFGDNADFAIAGGRGEFTLRSGERTTVTGLPANVGYTVTETETNGYTVTVSGGALTGGDSITSNVSDTPTVIFTNHKDSEPDPEPTEGTLVISKTVECAEGVVIGKDEGRSFKFTLQLTGRDIPEAGAVFGGLAFTNGKTTFYLKDGESVTLAGLPKDTEYTVTEEAASGFTSEAENARGTITAGQTVNCTFTNTKTENDRTGGFTLTKKLAEGTESSESFTFFVELDGLEANVVYRYGNESFTAPASGRIILELTLAGGESINFEGLPVGSTYSITEKANVYCASYVITDAQGEAKRAANPAAMTDLTTGIGTVTEGDSASISFTNSGATYKVRFAKYGEGGEFLSGAVLRVTDSQNRTVAEWTSESELTVKELPAGSFKLKEVTPPAGYSLNSEEVAFTVSADGALTVGGETAYVVAITDAKTEVSILKTDKAGAPLAGATLRVLDKNNVEVARFESTAEAKVLTGVISVGEEYVLSEVKAPEGYKLAEDVRFRLTADGRLLVNGAEAEKVTMADEKSEPDDPADPPPKPDDPKPDDPKPDDPKPDDPKPDDPKPDNNYSLTIAENTEGRDEADRDSFKFEITLSHESVELPQYIEVEGSRYPAAGKLRFTAVGESQTGSAGSGSGNASIRATVELSGGEEIKIKGLPDGTKITIVQSGGDEHWETQIDGETVKNRTVNKTVAGSDVTVSFTNVYSEEIEDQPKPFDKEPDTGDSFNLGLWLTVGILSLMGIAMVANRKKRA